MAACGSQLLFLHHLRFLLIHSFVIYLVCKNLDRLASHRRQVQPLIGSTFVIANQITCFSNTTPVLRAGSTIGNGWTGELDQDRVLSSSSCLRYAPKALNPGVFALVVLLKQVRCDADHRVRVILIDFTGVSYTTTPTTAPVPQIRSGRFQKPACLRRSSAPARCLLP